MIMHTCSALVVDDDAIARRTVGYALAQEDFDCTYASDVAEALMRLSEEAFDLVVTDLRMPNTRSHALVAKLLSCEQPPVIIVHSSVDDPRVTRDLLLNGVDDIVFKPTHYPAFAANARALVMRRKKTSKSAASIRSKVIGPSQNVGLELVPSLTTAETSNNSNSKINR